MQIHVLLYALYSEFPEQRNREANLCVEDRPVIDGRKVSRFYQSTPRKNETHCIITSNNWSTTMLQQFVVRLAWICIKILSAQAVTYTCVFTNFNYVSCEGWRANKYNGMCFMSCWMYVRWYEMLILHQTLIFVRPYLNKQNVLIIKRKK
jgi:hypothetical protein